MAFSAKAQYACLAVLELATRYGQTQPVRLVDVAASSQIPERFLVQILLQLKSAGIIKSIRGAAGGYLLAKDPEQLSVGDVLAVVGPPRRGQSVLGDTLEEEPAESGFNQHIQILQEVGEEVERAKQTVLDRTSFAELLRRAEQRADLIYQI